jgi:hypothetical protein
MFLRKIGETSLNFSLPLTTQICYSLLSFFGRLGSKSDHSVYSVPTGRNILLSNGNFLA